MTAAAFSATSDLCSFPPLSLEPPHISPIPTLVSPSSPGNVLSNAPPFGPTCGALPHTAPVLSPLWPLWLLRILLLIAIAPSGPLYSDSFLALSRKPLSASLLRPTAFPSHHASAPDTAFLAPHLPAAVGSLSPFLLPLLRPAIVVHPPWCVPPHAPLLSLVSTTHLFPHNPLAPRPDLLVCPVLPLAYSPVAHVAPHLSLSVSLSPKQQAPIDLPVSLAHTAPSAPLAIAARPSPRVSSHVLAAQTSCTIPLAHGFSCCPPEDRPASDLPLRFRGASHLPRAPPLANDLPPCSLGASRHSRASVLASCLHPLSRGALRCHLAFHLPSDLHPCLRSASRCFHLFRPP
ncbi:unnamed protein product [Closterium sp. Naga37s-1]|nr:unnamed protein product [Closterium sp. Naga37s-1]